MIIFLSILKIIGIVLLVLALVIAAILFVPIFYEFDADIDAGSYRFRVHWLLRLVRFKFYFQEKAEAILSILFFRIDFTDPEAKEKRKRRKEKRAARKRKKRARKHRSRKEKQRKAYEKEREKNRKKIELDADAPDEKQTAKIQEPVGEKLTEAAQAAEEAAEQAGFQVPDAVKNALHVVHAMYDNGVFGAVFPKLQIFLLRIQPQKIKGDLVFGFSDPATTGQVLGGIAMVPYLFRTELNIVPDFEAEKTYVSGNVYLKGRIFGIHLILFGIHIFFDKNVRRFMAALKKKK